MKRRASLRARAGKRLALKRAIRLEQLEGRQLLAADVGFMQNPFDPEDVNNDGVVSSNDALMILNRMRDGQRGDAQFTDVNGDGQQGAVDALMVLNRMQRGGGGPQQARAGGDRGDNGGNNNDDPRGGGDDTLAQLFRATEDGGYSVDGSGNNADDVAQGATHEQLLRLTSVEYADGISEPAGEDRVSAREISNAVAAQTEEIANERGLTDLTWLFGQFIDHDIDLTESADPAEPFNIQVPTGDVDFDPFGTGEVEIALNRSVYDESTGDSEENYRQQINEITPYLDGSVIYGSDDERALELRTLEGGLLKTSEGDLLPFNEAGLANAGGTSDTLFLAGDVRANENAALTSMHTLWVREHNRVAEQIGSENPELSDEEIFQMARALVTAELQAVTYNEFLPALLGEDAIDRYRGYDSDVDPQVATVFSTAAYRFGHSMLSSELLRLNADGTTADEGNISLQDAFFSPDEVTENGIDSFLIGAAAQVAQEVDTNVVDDVRNFLFGPPGAGGLDLVSLNIQRGRDNGLADYNQTRIDIGLEPVESFDQITSDAELAEKLESVYGTVDDIDVWVGGLAEDHVKGGSMGELFTAIIADQFERIRDGDSQWYQNIYSGETLRQIEQTSLADIIERNTEAVDLQENVFFDADQQPSRGRPGGNNDGPGGNNDGSGGNNDGPGGNNDGPGGNNDGPGGNNDGPGGNNDGPGGNNDGPGGNNDGPGGNNDGPGGNNDGPGGNNDGPGGNNDGPGGNQPRGDRDDGQRPRGQATPAPLVVGEADDDDERGNAVDEVFAQIGGRGR